MRNPTRSWATRIPRAGMHRACYCVCKSTFRTPLTVLVVVLGLSEPTRVPDGIKLREKSSGNLGPTTSSINKHLRQVEVIPIDRVSCAPQKPDRHDVSSHV